MTTENPDLAAASPAPRRFVAWRRFALGALLMTPILALAVPFIVVSRRGQPISAYPFVMNLPAALVGLYMAGIGVLFLAWADIGKNPFGKPNHEGQTLAGACDIGFGLWFVAFEGLPLLLRPSDLFVNILWPWLLLWPLVVAVPFVLPALWKRIHRPSLPEHPSTTQATRVSRRTLLLGAGVAAIGATGIGALLVRLPTMIPRVELRGDILFPGGLSWSPDGRRIATTDGQREARVWSAAMGTAKARHSQAFGTGAISWSPDGRRVATASWDSEGPIQVWDAATGRTLLTFADTSGEALAWSPRDNRIATSTFDNTIVIFDGTTGKEILRFDANTDASWLAWSPDAQTLATPFGDGAALWDASTGRRIATIATKQIYLGSVAWAPDSTRLATAGQDGTVRIFRVQDGAQLAVYRGHSEEVRAVAWSPDGRFVVSGGDDDTAQVWSAVTGRHVYTWNGHMDIVKYVAWQPGGSLVASGSYDSTVQIWQPQLS